MRLLLDPKNEELADILNTLLTDNIDITAREVARKRPANPILKAALL